MLRARREAEMRARTWMNLQQELARKKGGNAGGTDLADFGGGGASSSGAHGLDAEIAAGEAGCGDWASSGVCCGALPLCTAVSWVLQGIRGDSLRRPPNTSPLCCGRHPAGGRTVGEGGDKAGAGTAARRAALEVRKDTPVMHIEARHMQVGQGGLVRSCQVGACHGDEGCSGSFAPATLPPESALNCP